MKAILVIDMPTSCSMCWVRDMFCEPYRTEPKHKGYNERLDGCPLRPITEEASNILLQGLDHMEELKNVKVHYFNDLMEEEE